MISVKEDPCGGCRGKRGERTAAKKRRIIELDLYTRVTKQEFSLKQ